MIEADDAAKMTEALAKNLAGVAKSEDNFAKLPDKYWGYYARGHDGKGKFAVIVTYSENEGDVDELIKIYEAWVAKSRSPAR